MQKIRGDEKYEAEDITDLARAIYHIYVSKNIHHIVFCLDSADEELHQNLLTEIFGSYGLINHPKLHKSLELSGEIRRGDIKLQVVVAALRPFIEIKEYPPDFSLDRKQILQLQKDPNPARDPIKNMLRQLANHHRFDLHKANCDRISTEVYYLTGGHPKCAKLVLFDVADKEFLPLGEDWGVFFESRVLPTIEGEMLTLVSNNLLPIFKVLSVFRIFDPSILADLLQSQAIHIPFNTGSMLSRVNWLRKKLLETYLVNYPQTDPVFEMNFVARRVLYLRMRQRSPQIHKEINALALQKFEERLQNASLISFNECIYHKLRDLELNGHRGKICEKLRTYVREKLQSFVKGINEMQRPMQLSVLQHRWHKDDELKEAIERVVGTPQSYETLSQDIRNFIEEN